MGRKILIQMPLAMVDLSGKRRTLSLNHYHNWHYQVRNRLKHQYSVLAKLRMPNGVKFERVALKLTLFKRSNQRVDRANFLAVHEKFFCDAAVQKGIIEDDNDSVIMSTTYLSGGVDRDFPRVEIEMMEVEE